MKRSKYGAVRTEAQEQAALIEWCDLKGHPYNLIFAVHNGVRVSIGQAMKMKKAGMKKGVPDLFLPVRKKEVGGLFIELKRLGGGRTSKEQVGWHYILRWEGYQVETCRGFEAAKRVIENYLQAKMKMPPSTD